MGNVVPFDGLSSQEFMFANAYVKCTNTVYSAYVAGCYGYKEEKEFINLDKKELHKLRVRGNQLAKKQKVREYLADLCQKEAEEGKIAELKEILQTLTEIIRRTRKEPKSVKVANTAIKAMELLVKYYPEFENGNKEQEDLKFYRGVENESG